MTGYFVRARRDSGRIESVELDQLTDTELDQFIAGGSAKVDGWKWVRALTIWIREHAKEHADTPGQ